MTNKATLVHLPIDRIRPGRNVRVDQTDINTLAESLQDHGMLQPITVVPTADGSEVEVLFGHRRLAAARRAHLELVPCFVRPRGTERTRLLTQIAENFERKSMTHLDQAYAFRELRDGGMTFMQIAKAVGLSITTVTNICRLLDYPEVVQRAVHERSVHLHDALVLPLSLAQETPPDELLSHCIRGGRFLREWVRATLAADPNGNAKKLQAKRDIVQVTLDGALHAEIRAAAAEMKLSITEWVGRACRAQLAAQTARRSEPRQPDDGSSWSAALHRAGRT